MKFIKSPIILLGTLIAQLSLTLSAFATTTSQSPINFTPASTVYSILPTLGYNYGTNVGLHVFNNGSPDEDATVKANVTSGSASLTVSGSSYNLLQFHFHTHSEHLLNGTGFPMELHLVHQRVGSTGNADLLVTGRWIIDGAENAILANIFSNLPTDTATSDNVDNFILSGLIPPSLTSYRYVGSLTTPGYDEGVQWVFHDTPLEMSAAQIQSFKTLFPAGNARDVQELYGRTILTDVVPEPSGLALLGLGTIILLFTRSRR